MALSRKKQLEAVLQTDRSEDLIEAVNRIEQRILEAEKLGFSRIFIPHNKLKGFDTAKSKIQIVQVKKVEEAFRQLFG